MFHLTRLFWPAQAALSSSSGPFCHWYCETHRKHNHHTCIIFELPTPHTYVPPPLQFLLPRPMFYDKCCPPDGLKFQGPKEDNQLCCLYDPSLHCSGTGLKVIAYVPVNNIYWPLYYGVVMQPKFLWQLPSLACICGFMVSTNQTTLVFQLPLCGHHGVDDFYVWGACPGENNLNGYNMPRKWCHSIHSPLGSDSSRVYSILLLLALLGMWK